MSWVCFGGSSVKCNMDHPKSLLKLNTFWGSGFGRRDRGPILISENSCGSSEVNEDSFSGGYSDCHKWRDRNYGAILHAGSRVRVSGEWPTCPAEELVLDRWRVTFLSYSGVAQIAKQKELSGKSRSFLLSWVHLSEYGWHPRGGYRRENKHMAFSSHYLKTLRHLWISLAKFI